jgi:anti-sigma factor RsiW
MNEREYVTFEELVDYVEGRLGASRAEEVNAALAKSPLLQDQVSWIRALTDLRPETVLVAPPQSVRAKLESAFRTHAASASVENAHPQRAPATSDAAANKWWRRLVATLTLDSGTAPLAAGVRGASSASRQLLYSTQEADIVLSIIAATDPTFGLLEAHGQLLPVDFAQGDADSENVQSMAQDLQPYAVQLLRADREVALTSSDEFGEFHLLNLEPAEYELVLSGERHEITLHAVPIQL